MILDNNNYSPTTVVTANILIQQEVPQPQQHQQQQQHQVPIAIIGKLSNPHPLIGSNHLKEPDPKHDALFQHNNPFGVHPYS
mmetsp:Transcript_5061/g.5835  ORF Transcript_5061/g.5835 Transcript_5061/m.5835 type:complete len:82 (-) Transcript_5061:75-320(-)